MRRNIKDSPNHELKIDKKTHGLIEIVTAEQTMKNNNKSKAEKFLMLVPSTFCRVKIANEIIIKSINNFSKKLLSNVKL